MERLRTSSKGPLVTVVPRADVAGSCNWNWGAAILGPARLEGRYIVSRAVRRNLAVTWTQLRHRLELSPYWRSYPL